MKDFKGCSVRRYWFQYKWSNIFEMIRDMSGKPKTCSERFDGRLVVITGATSGIGYETAKKYASNGARLLTINRNKEKSETLCREISHRYGTECNYILADLSKLKDVKNVVEKLNSLNSRIAVLIHNAGLYLNKRTLTEDGLEMNFVVHYLAPFIINYFLIDKLKRDGSTRIIFVSSEGYRFASWGICLDNLQWEKKKYSGLKAYGSAKLAQILSMHIFAEIFSSENMNVTINAMHPGFVKTNTGQDNGPVYKFFKKNFLDKLSRDPVESAEALYYLGVSKDVESITDKFFHYTTIEELAPPAKDMELAKMLWEKTLKIISEKYLNLEVK